MIRIPWLIWEVALVTEICFGVARGTILNSTLVAKRINRNNQIHQEKYCECPVEGKLLHIDSKCDVFVKELLSFYKLGLEDSDA